MPSCAKTITRNGSARVAAAEARRRGGCWRSATPGRDRRVRAPPPGRARVLRSDGARLPVRPGGARRVRRRTHGGGHGRTHPRRAARLALGGIPARSRQSHARATLRDSARVQRLGDPHRRRDRGPRRAPPGTPGGQDPPARHHAGADGRAPGSARRPRSRRRSGRVARPDRHRAALRHGRARIRADRARRGRRRPRPAHGARAGQGCERTRRPVRRARPQHPPPLPRGGAAGPRRRALRTGAAARCVGPLDRALERGAITMRGYDRALRLAWTLADLDGAAGPSADHIGRALFLRRGIGA